MAALLTDTSVPIVRRKEVADSRLSPGVSAGRSETAPGFSTVTRSAWATVPHGYTSHRVLLPLLYSASEGAATGAEYIRRCNFCNHPLLMTSTVIHRSNFLETSPRMFHRKHCQRAAFFAPIGWLRESKESGTVHRNTARPRNAAGEGMFRLNTEGVLLRGAGLCGRRYSRCTHCHEPHGGTVSNQTKSCKHDFFPVC